jgi:DNA-binding MarR family transcriptional regulator
MIRVQIIYMTKFQLDQAPGHLLRRAQQRAVELFAAELGSDGPTPQQFALLLAIGQNPGISQVGLVREIGVDRSTLAEMVQRLARRGLIVRRRTPSDGRENALSLSAAGARLLARALPAVIRTQQRILAPIPARQRKAALQLLRLMAGM